MKNETDVRRVALAALRADADALEVAVAVLRVRGPHHLAERLQTAQREWREQADRMEAIANTLDGIGI